MDNNEKNMKGVDELRAEVARRTEERAQLAALAQRLGEEAGRAIANGDVVAAGKVESKRAGLPAQLAAAEVGFYAAQAALYEAEHAEAHSAWRAYRPTVDEARQAAEAAERERSRVAAEYSRLQTLSSMARDRLNSAKNKLDEARQRGAQVIV